MNNVSVPSKEVHLSNSSIVHQYRLVNNTNDRRSNEEFDPEAFEFIIEYAYTAKLAVPREKVREVYAIASRLKMTNVAAKCGQFLLETLTSENCFDIRSIRSVMKDAYLLQSVDGYIKQNFEQIVKDRDSSGITVNALPHAKIEFVLNSEKEESCINERTMFNEVIDWIKSAFANEILDWGMVTEKMIMLYYNKQSNRIEDCAHIDQNENSPPEECERIEDYRKMSKKMASNGLAKSLSNDNINQTIVTNNHQNGNSNIPKHNNLSQQQVPSKPRQFLFARSDSESSLSSLIDDEEHDWKMLANCRLGEHTLVGLASMDGRLCLVTITLRVNHSVNQLTNVQLQRGDSVDNDTLASCLIPPMSTPRCAVGTAELDGKLFVCGKFSNPIGSE